MDCYLKQELRTNEKIIWEARPKNIQLFNTPYNLIILKYWCLSLSMAILLILYIERAKFINVSASEIFAISFVIFLLITYQVLHPLIDVVRLKNKFYYYFTNQRFIVYKKNGLNYRIQSLGFSEIKESTFDLQNNGNYNIFLGPLTKDIYSHSRNDIGYTTNTDSIVFCNISNEAAEIFYHLLPLHIRTTRIGQKDQRNRRVSPSFAAGGNYAKNN